MKLFRRLPSVILAATLLAVGGVAGTAVGGGADPSTPATQGDPLRTCSDLAKDTTPDLDYDRTYDPETGNLTLAGINGVYGLNVHDPECLQYPQVKTIIDDVLSVYATNQSEECSGISKQLASLDPKLLATEGATIDSPKGTVDLDALIRYGKEVCGGSIPGVPGT
jgi:hypothetical protein